MVDLGAIVTATPSAQSPEFLDPADLQPLIQTHLARREEYLHLVRRHGSPLYVLDRAVLQSRADQFTTAFRRHLPEFQAFFAVKSNNSPLVSKTLVKAGLGLDVSSGVELRQALDCHAEQILFSGPGKTDAELEFAVKHAAHVTILIDSFGELERLERIAARRHTVVRAGVRLTTDDRGLWRKFGIPLGRLPKFIGLASRCRYVDLCGLQFHVSWNLNASTHVAFIERLGKILLSLPSEVLNTIEFIDIGGGYWPSQGEWLHTANSAPVYLDRAAGSVNGLLRHVRKPAISITAFADEIAGALHRFIFPRVNCSIYAEPGRWVCNDAMHLLLTVVDRKAEDLVITDGGTNIVGWERYEVDYCPILNLSRPDSVERRCDILGSLCTPHDVWGYSYFGSDIKVGDVLLIPEQGAYTYSLRQEFIKPLANVVDLDTHERY